MTTNHLSRHRCPASPTFFWSCFLFCHPRDRRVFSPTPPLLYLPCERWGNLETRAVSRVRSSCKALDLERVPEHSLLFVRLILGWLWCIWHVKIEKFLRKLNRNARRSCVVQKRKLHKLQLLFARQRDGSIRHSGQQTVRQLSGCCRAERVGSLLI